MNAVSFGPLVMDASRFAAVLAIFAFLIAAALLAGKVDARFNRWTWVALIVALIAARTGHVIHNWASFSAEPLRVFAVWQGGFYWPLALVGLAATILFVLRPWRLRLWALVPVAVALFVWSGASALIGAPRAIALPVQQFETIADEPFSFAQSSGKPRVINLWASWCPPCRREMPMMADMAANNQKVQFVFANQGEGHEAVQAYLHNEKLNFSQLILDRFSDLSRHYGAPGLPATLFIGADGVLKSAHLGEISRETLQSNIDRLTSGL